MTRRIQQLFDLTGQTALITGGSRGLGLQMAHALGEAGARLMLCSRKADDLEAAVAELKAAGIEAFNADGRHLVLKANHPSPLSALRPPLQFMGCGHFGQVNQWLVAQNKNPIVW